MWSTRDRMRTGDGVLDRAIADLRSHAAVGEHLSEGCRSRVLEAVGRAHDEQTPLVGVFGPRRRFLVAAGVSVVLAAALLAFPRKEESSHPSVAIQASKQGDRVVFALSNGSRSHRVYRSTEARAVELAAPVLVTNGLYVDSRPSQGADVVYYRID